MNRFVFLILACMFVITGCGKNHGVSDLQTFTKKAFENKKPAVDPLPALQPAAVFVYTATEEKDPFNEANLVVQKVKVEDTTDDGENAPDLTRKKEPLEAYPIDALQLVGLLNKSGIDWAIINAPDNTVHRVAEGNYMGKDNGVIVLLQNNLIRVDERVKNSTGKWEDKPVELALENGS